MKQTNKQQPITSQLKNWNLKNKRVLVRIDGDVPLKNGTLTDDTRLKDTLPTLECIKQHNGKIIVATHIGRPTKHDPVLSTQILIPWLEAHSFTVTFAPDLTTAQKISNNSTTDVVLLENLRFHPEEQQQQDDARKLTFAKQLASLGDFYVNEAFGTSHRADTSMTLVPQQFKPDHRTVGFHCAQEVNILNQLKNNAARPFVFIMGGGKVADKLPYLLNLLPLADNILLCPALVFTLLKAEGKEVGASLIADDALAIAHKILTSPDAATKLIFPTDYQVAKKTIDGELSIIAADEFTSEMIGIAIGPKTINEFTEIIEKAGTIFFNGPMGFQNRPETMTASCQLLKAMAHSPAYTIVGGGDAVHAAYQCGIASEIHHLSTGGGAALALLSGLSLPGLEFLM